ncbi:probable mediator of RNA polymerase II transcription subunit 26c isoform X1 [Chenopodium quinoa]|uniref:probable mediator of RNA polymerase II transcription subunit 26c isoform X1 n=1 Tax=Chenopodium quinoa TaxID=63459 RepID=UPI000B7712B6|nr:probable mediator of RNA polymerase II transcription subunit 26c isoform X1 [Chenopodium quinoa]XP_021713954.1 probable mediator of RNA polymerase II transcription subunit 26c isoform X1 [Chenopodium quinoa]
MDLDDFRGILGNSGVDIWGIIDTAIKVASLDYGDELRLRRDGIVEKLYTNCHNCEAAICNDNKTNNGFVTNAVVEAVFGSEREMNPRKSNSPSTPVSIRGGDDVDEEAEVDVEEELEQEFQGRRFVENEEDDEEDDELRRILSVREQIEDTNQSEDSLVDLLQSLADVDITFKALKETDIGRHVNRLRKHPSGDVRRLVKVLVRKWKDLVDEWVRSNTPGEVQSSNNLIVDGDSPLQTVSKNHQNGNHNQVPDFAYSPNPHNGSFVSDKNISEMEPKRKAPLPPPRRDPPARPMKSSSPASAPPPNKQKEVRIDPDRLASARKRLQENYQEAQNAKKQRTIQVMDIHEIPKPRNSFFGRNKGGFQRH